MLMVLVTLPIGSLAQNVAINEDGSGPDNSAILDLASTSRGLLTPRMTTVQRTAITTPATGLLVFDTDSAAFFYYDGSTWATLDTINYAYPIAGSAYENNIDGTNSSYSVGTSYIGDTTLSAGELSGITFSDDNTNGDYLEIPTGGGGLYAIHLTMSFRGDNGTENRVGVFKNSDAAPMAGIAFERSTSNNASGSAAATGIVQLAAGDLIRIKFKTDSPGNAFDIVVQAISVIKLD